MQELFARTLSQGLQAFMPAAIALAWLRQSRQAARVAAVRRGLLAAIPLTAIGGWLFQASNYQARWESLMAIAVTAIVLVCGLSVWRSLPIPDARGADRTPAFWSSVTTAGATVVLVRQTMLMAAVFGVAAIQMRSLEATAAVAGAAALAIGMAVAWVRLGNRLPRRALVNATKTFAALFLAQVAFYAVHKSAEAGFLPWSERIDSATEPYGPDSIFGRYVSYLLAGVPAVVAISTALGEKYRSVHHWPSVVGVRRAVLVTSGVIVIACFVLAGTKTYGVFIPGRNGAAAGGSANELTSIVAAPHVVFLSKASDANDGLLSVASLRAPAAERASGGLRCERVSFAGRQGICLQADGRLFMTYRATLFDEQLQPRTSFKLDGRPSRTRVSADGRVGAITMFVTGHGYASAFSTRTILLDMASGDVLGDLEQFTTWRDGKRFAAPDFNFWGVTFTRNSNVFYASLRTIVDVPLPQGQVRRAQTYLVRGDLGLRKLTVVHENVECPSLSPNDRLIAYKKNVGPGPAPWRFHVLDLATMTERPIGAETRSIDDQIEWLDDAHVLYGTFRSAKSPLIDVFAAPIDGSEPARVFLPAAESPIVVR